MSTPSQRDALIEELLRQYRKHLEEQLPERELTLDQIEKVAGEIGEQASQDLQRHLVQRQTRKPRPKRQDCQCGQPARYKGEQPRTLVTVHGVLHLQRACYYCPTCQHTFAPEDIPLGLDSSCTTTQVRLWVAWLCALLPFTQAASTLQMLSHVALSAGTLERLTVALGQALRTKQQHEAQIHREDTSPQPLPTKTLRRLYVGMDGLFVPLREAWKRDGSQGKLACRYGECKVGVVYQTAKDDHGKDSRVTVSDYTATFAGVGVFEPLLATLAHTNGHHAAQELVVLGDGAAWIWQTASKQFPGAVQIVDFFHACAHLATYSEARFGKESVQGKDWQQARQQELKTGQMPAVLGAIKEWRPSNAAKRTIRKETYLYFANNAARMRYAQYLQKGYHIGSGVVEASCKHVIAQRLDQAGMHWRQESAEAVAALRAAQLSTHPPDLRLHCAMPQ